MPKPFQDLRITGLLSERCYVVEGSILRIYLQFSDTPPLGWSYMFSLVWQAVQYPAKRPAGVEGDTIWIECAPNEVKQYHLAELEGAVAQTNEYYRSSQVESVVAEQQEEELDSQIQAQLDELANSLNPVGNSSTPLKRSPRLGIGNALRALRRALTFPTRGD
jgi:hypothetical protein